MKFPALFGHPARVQAAFTRKIERPEFAAEGPHKWLFFGPPGLAKSMIAHSIQKRLDPDGLGSLSLNGKELTVEEIRKWRKSMRTRPMGSWWITVIDELDRASRDAQDLMLSWLDHLPEFAIVIATTNQNLDELQERLHTRFQQIRFEQPSDQEIYDALKAAGLPPDVAEKIATGCKGNVRAAEMDATTWEDFHAP
jgi:replication-associated recombination protein RarA